MCQAWFVSREKRAGSLRMNLGWGCASSRAVSGPGRVDLINRKGILAASWHEVRPSPKQQAPGEAPCQSPAFLGLEVGSPCSLDTWRMERGPRHGVTLPPLCIIAGTRARYVDVLNPGGPQRSEPALAPTDLFAPLAPLPIPAHLLGPNTGTQPTQQGCSPPAC